MGKKTAEKITLELAGKWKLPLNRANVSSKSKEDSSSSRTEQLPGPARKGALFDDEKIEQSELQDKKQFLTTLNDVSSALENLGFKQKDFSSHLQNISYSHSKNYKFHDLMSLVLKELRPKL